MGHRRFLLFVILLPLLAGCGVTIVAAVPLRMAEQGTARPLPTVEPTVARPVPTSRPAIASSATPAATSMPPAPMRGAAPPIKPAMVERLWRVIRQMQSATSYRMTFRVDVPRTTGDATVLRDDTVEVGGTHVHELEHSTETVKSGMPQGLEVSMVDGTVNVHGPLPVNGAQAARWYQVAQLPRSGVVLQFLAGPALRRLTQDVPLADLQSLGMVGLDGLTCDRFDGGRSAVLAALNNSGRLVQPGKERPVEEQRAGVIFEQTDYHLTLCSDDQIHQIEVNMRSHVGDSANNLHMLLHIWDINIPVAVPAPTAAQPLALPGIMFALPISCTALVTNGGNMRQSPVSGAVLDQANAGEALDIVARSADSSWLLVSNPRRVTGWMSASLLAVDPRVLPLISTSQ